MNEQILLVVMYSFWILLIGRLIFRCFFKNIYHKSSIFIGFGISWALGNFFLMTFLHILLYFNKLSFITRIIFIYAFLITVIANILVFFYDLIQRRIKISLINLFIFTLLLIFFTPLIINSFFSFYIEMDAVAIWLLKAKLFFLSSGIREATLYMNESLYLYSSKAYPVGFPLLISAYYRIVHFANDQTVQFYLLVYYLSLVASSFGFVNLFLKNMHTLSKILITLSFFITPIFIIHAHNGYADLPLAFVFNLSVILLIQFISKNNLKEKIEYFLLMLLISSLGASFKNEGYVFFIIINATLLAILVKDIFAEKSSRQKKTLLLPVFISFVFSILHIVIWFFISKSINQSHYLQDSNISVDSLRRLKPVIFHYMDQLLYGEKYGVLFPMAFIIFITSSTMLMVNKMYKNLIPAIVIVMQLIAYTLTYCITTMPLTIQLYTSFYRLLLHLIPSLFIVVIYQFRTVFLYFENDSLKK